MPIPFETGGRRIANEFFDVARNVAAVEVHTNRFIRKP
jgi:hypothetical protein